MKTILHRFLGGFNTPQDIKDLRSASFDFHEELGYPVVFKHRWTEKDQRLGLVQSCPLNDDLYSQDKTSCPICFGTGFVGGFKDAEIVFISLGDAPTDSIKITDQGLLTFDQHPQMTAPWIPPMEDGDLLIMATFDPETWDIMDIGDRYELKTVDQITIRGPGYTRLGRGASGKPFIVHQEGEVDKLPYKHYLYNVPLIFDPSDVPPDIWPPGEDPDLPDPEIGTHTEFSTNVRIRGAEEKLHSSYNQVIKIAVSEIPTGSSYDQAIRVSVDTSNEMELGISIVGWDEGGVDFNW